MKTWSIESLMSRPKLACSDHP